ncbi:MAG: sugar transferase [Eubacteriales bacterium]
MKRILDIFFSAIAIFFLSPLLLALSIVVLIDDGFPVIFKQDRVGKDSKHFKIRKFRTMKKGTRNAPTAKLEEAEECITHSGRFLRRTSLDELLQLLNIFDGTMSFIGPRPLIPEEKEIHVLREKYGVYKVRPGMTGWAQINGRDSLTDEEKAKYDKEYVEKHNLLFDAKILFKTFSTVLKGEDIVEGSEKKEKKIL